MPVFWIPSGVCPGLPAVGAPRLWRSQGGWLGAWPPTAPCRLLGISQGPPLGGVHRPRFPPTGRTHHSGMWLGSRGGVFPRGLALGRVVYLFLFSQAALRRGDKPFVSHPSGPAMQPNPASLAARARGERSRSNSRRSLSNRPPLARSSPAAVLTAAPVAVTSQEVAQRLEQVETLKGFHEDGAKLL